MADPVTIFCEIDDFCKEFKNQYEQRLLSAGKGKRKRAFTMTLIFLLTRKLADCTGLSFIDSFKLEACHIKRAPKHKVLASIAKKSKTSTGWFYGTNEISGLAFAEEKVARTSLVEVQFHRLCYFTFSFYYH
jgi:hypothetical protein